MAIDNGQKGMDLRKIAGIIILVVLFAAGVMGGYLYFSKMISKHTSAPGAVNENPAKAEDFITLRIYYPVGDQLQIEERSLARRTGEMEVAGATVEEYFKGTGRPGPTTIPKDVRLLGLYQGEDKILYVDLSDELRRNFQGDALAEFLLLKGLYESIISNVEDIGDVKVLIEGKEAETLGGHFFLLYPLKDMVSYEYH